MTHLRLALIAALLPAIALAQEVIEVTPLDGLDLVPMEEAMDGLQLVPSTEVPGGLELVPMGDGENLPDGYIAGDTLEDTLSGLLDQALDAEEIALGDVVVEEHEVAVTGTGAHLRGLDKLAGTAVDMPMAAGDTTMLGWLEVTLGECRYPEANPAGDAFAHIVVRDTHADTQLFDGWMIASSPALSALDHARYDVWVTSCTTE